MGQNSKIEWTDHTFNPWWGCLKVSEACKNCYAEALARRFGQQVWGAASDRRFFSDSHWNEPLKWNRRLEGTGQRQRVFCASMADVFEPREDLNVSRNRLWDLIGRTPHLDWLLLTKRPLAVSDLAPWGNDWPDNVWLGTTIELQKRADEGLPAFIEVPAKVRFISAEPLLGPLDLQAYLPSIDWVIAGGESGRSARPSSPAWFRSLMLQCMENDVAFHFKQWGDWAPATGGINLAKLRTTRAADGSIMARLGKSRAGRQLDGQEHDELPNRNRA